MILAVENTRKFHEENVLKNKSHYTYFVRSTNFKIVHKLQEYGARMHFNHIRINDCEYVKELSEGQECSVKIRYGVINMDDMLRDL